jgi:hypothetical protein
MGGLALLKTGDRVRIDLRRGTADMLVPDAELAARRAALEAAGGYAYPPSQTPWQEIQRERVGQLATGAILKAPRSTSASRRRGACRATTTDPRPRLTRAPVGHPRARSAGQQSLPFCTKGTIDAWQIPPERS